MPASDLSKCLHDRLMFDYRVLRILRIQTFKQGIFMKFYDKIWDFSALTQEKNFS